MLPRLPPPWSLVAVKKTKRKAEAAFKASLYFTLPCQLTRVFKEQVPEAKLERVSGAEVSYIIPFQSSGKFPQLFSLLDDTADQLGINGYGATITTMEEVFLKSVELSSRKAPLNLLLSALRLPDN